MIFLIALRLRWSSSSVHDDESKAPFERTMLIRVLFPAIFLRCKEACLTTELPKMLLVAAVRL